MNCDPHSCKICIIRNLSMLKYCSNDELEMLDDTKTCVTYKAGQIIFHEGNHPNALFCVNAGKIKLHKMGTDGKVQIVRLIKPGDFLGYRSLLSSTPYSASASVMEEARVCKIPKNTFFEILKENNSISEGMFKLLCSNLQDSEEKLTQMAYKPVRERLAEALLLLKTTYHDKNSSEDFTISISREDLASLVGTAKETVIRLLSEFKNENFVSSKGRKITILDFNELLKISHLYD